MEEYTVKIRDYDQDIIHTLKQLAHSQREANTVVLKLLRDMLGHDNLEII